MAPVTHTHTHAHVRHIYHPKFPHALPHNMFRCFAAEEEPELYENVSILAARADVPSDTEEMYEALDGATPTHSTALTTTHPATHIPVRPTPHTAALPTPPPARVHAARGPVGGEEVYEALEDIHGPPQPVGGEEVYEALEDIHGPPEPVGGEEVYEALEDIHSREGLPQPEGGEEPYQGGNDTYEALEGINSPTVATGNEGDRNELYENIGADALTDCMSGRVVVEWGDV